MNKIYFPNLNGIRFIAALMVIVHHTEQIKGILGFPNNWSNNVVFEIGKLGVVLFFVLSGFLITYLLLAEEKETKTISIKQFYVRRILRIWPLYYFIVLLGFLVLPHTYFFRVPDLTAVVYDGLYIKLALFLFFLPNLALCIFPAVPYAAQTWSVGVEEQFYLIWPVLMKTIKNKKLLLFSIIAMYLFLKLIGLPFVRDYLFWNKGMQTFSEFFSGFSIDCMAIGGLFGLFLFNGDKILKILFSKYTQVITMALVIIMVAKDIQVPYVYYELYSVLFGIIIVNLAGNPHSILNLEFQPLHYLGQISYGLYMYHPLGITIGVKLLNFVGTRNPVAQYLLSIALTIAIAGLSYKYFEKYFVRMKVRFSKVISGDNAKAN